MKVDLAPAERADGPQRRASRGRPGTRRQWHLVLVLCVLAVVVPALVSWWSGSLRIPQIDGWSYRRTAETFSATGSFALTGYSAMTLVGQVLWSWPFLRVFGSSGWGFPVSTAVLGVLGIVSAFQLSRKVLDTRRAVAAVLLLVLAPGFAWNTSTFMTDVPTTTAELLCLALGVAALARLGRARWALLGLSLVVGVFGFAIREFAGIAPFAVLLCAAVGDERRQRVKYVLAGLAELGICIAIYLWWLRLPGGFHEPLLFPSWLTLLRFVQAYFTLAFMLSPVLVTALWRRRRALVRWRALLGPALVLVLGEVVARRGGSLFVGDFLTRNGAVGNLLLDGSRPSVFPQPLWGLVSLVGVLAGGALAGLVLGSSAEHLERWRSWDWSSAAGLLRVFAILFTAGSVLYLVGTTMLWDRYLWPLVFVGGVLLLRGDAATAPRRGPALRATTGMLWVLLAVVTAMLTLNADSYAAGRWRAGERAVASGVPATRVDAGFEWVGLHSRGVAREGLRPKAPPYEPWYARMQPGFEDCAVVSGSPLAHHGLRPIGISTYRLYAAFGPSEPLYIYRVPSCKRG